jgi:hypothetical protein
MSADDAGKRKLKPVEAFAAITYDRVLIIHKTNGSTYVQKRSRDQYHWLSLNRHGAYCGEWDDDRSFSLGTVKQWLKSEHCHDQEIESISTLKTRVQQMLEVTKNPETQ